MATVDNKHILFSKQYIGQLIKKIVKIDGVVQQLIASKTLSEAEQSSLRNRKAADKKFRHLLTILTDHSNRKDLKAFKAFIDILDATANTDIAQQILPIYNERVNHAEIISQLSKQKLLIEDLKNEISRLQKILNEKKGCIRMLKCEKKLLVEFYNKVANDQTKTSTEEKLSLEKQINKSKEDILLMEKEMEELTRKKNDLENEVELKSNEIHKKDKEIVEKERKLKEAIEESDRLQNEIDTLQQQQSKAMVEDKEMSTKIEILEDELDKKENTIVELRNNKTMTRVEVEEELGKIMKVQGEKMDAQTASIDSLTKANLASKKQMDDLGVMFQTFMREFKEKK